jgi:hypothetical protein
MLWLHAALRLTLAHNTNPPMRRLWIFISVQDAVNERLVIRRIWDIHFKGVGAVRLDVAQRLLADETIADCHKVVIQVIHALILTQANGHSTTG